MNTEIQEQDDTIHRFTREKKHANETIQKTNEDLQASEDRNSHLNKVSTVCIHLSILFFYNVKLKRPNDAKYLCSHDFWFRLRLNLNRPLMN